jgi:hypothetical protein
MNDPPDTADPEREVEDGPATNDPRPHRRSSRPRDYRANSTTVARRSARREPTPLSDPPQNLLDLVWRLLGDNRRAAWCLVFVLVFAIAVMGTVMVLGPQLSVIVRSASGAMAGIVGGSTAVGTVYGIRKAVRSRRERPQS